jgi:hypothetical protein
VVIATKSPSGCEANAQRKRVVEFEPLPSVHFVRDHVSVDAVRALRVCGQYGPDRIAVAQREKSFQFLDARHPVQVGSVADLANGVYQQPLGLLASRRGHVHVDLSTVGIAEQQVVADQRGQRRLAVFLGNLDVRVPKSPHVAAPFGTRLDPAKDPLQHVMLPFQQLKLLALERAFCQGTVL